MAVKLSTGDDSLEENHDINVTPFIDVMLVLLIIFMVAAPLSTVDVNVDLPASTAQAAQRPDKPVFVTIKPDLTLAVGETAVSRDGLAAAVSAATGGDTQQRIFLRGDKTIAYGNVMDMMNVLRKAGYLKIALVGLDASQAPDQSGAASPSAP
ncbi:TonB system transport protein ExbD [uncultured Methylovirgula sp.]|uniref:TonB system transport protein ExbD n=1 Tax=uncultured Methylovirgula sp. TaxID=1285960 RepID=UPI00260CF7CE|nr:TonB system transport protein ExbD [uncultured Methylovirgula sp.]